MSAACTATFALIAMSAAPPSNKILTVTPEINRPKGRLPGHSNTRGHFWLSPEGHNERNTSVRVLARCYTTAGLRRVRGAAGRPLFPFGQSTVFQNPKKLGVANSAPATPVMDGEGPVFAFFETPQRERLRS